MNPAYPVVRIGTRGSRLALVQARHVAKLLRQKNNRLKIRLVIIQTTGDRHRDRGVQALSEIGVFTKALETALLKNQIDAAVHSLKDLPTTLKEGLALACHLKREDPRDALVAFPKKSLKALRWGALVGTSSPRRSLQLKRLRPDLRLRALRGNITTRIAKARSGAYDAVVLAMAGIKRIQRFLNACHPLSTETVIPCPGQGIIAVEARTHDHRVMRLFKDLNDPLSESQALSERSFLHTLKAGCRFPLGGFARRRGNKLVFNAIALCPKTGRSLSACAIGSLQNPARLGQTVARMLIRRGALAFKP